MTAIELTDADRRLIVHALARLTKTTDPRVLDPEVVAELTARLTPH